MSDDAATLDASNTFLTWSGDRGKAVARALRGWLPAVVQLCRPWMSSEDMRAGMRWRNEVSSHLESINFGVLCLTPENVAEPWVNFEAGALSRRVSHARVVPYCFDLLPTDYPSPLGDLQGVKADEDGTLQLVRSINEAMPAPILDVHLEAVFRRMWEDLNAALKKVPTGPGQPKAPKRSTEDLLADVLERLKAIEASPAFTDVGPFGSRGSFMPDTMGSPTGGRRLVPPDNVSAAMGVFGVSPTILPPSKTDTGPTGARPTPDPSVIATRGTYNEPGPTGTSGPTSK